MKYLAIILVFAAAAGGYYYYVENIAEITPDTPEEAPFVAKAKELFPGDRRAQEEWLDEARTISAKIAEISAPKSTEEFSKIKSAAEKLYPFEFQNRLEYVRKHAGALRQIETYSRDERLRDSEYVMLVKLAAEKHPDDFVKRRDLINSYMPMFSAVRQAEENGSDKHVRELYSQFISEFPKNPRGAFAKFESLCKAYEDFENRHLPPEIDGAREYISSRTKDLQARADELAALANDPKKWINRSLLASAKPDWKTFGKIKDEHRAIVDKSIYMSSIDGKAFTAIYVSCGGNRYFVAPVGYFPGNLSEVEFTRGDEKIKAVPVRLGPNFIFYSPSTPPKGRAVRAEFLRHVPPAASAFGANAFGKIVSTYCSIERCEKGEIVFYGSGMQDLLATESFIVSASADEVYAFGMRGSPIHKNPEALSSEDLFVRAKNSKTALPNLAKTFRPDFTVSKAKPKDIVFWQIGYDLDKAETYDVKKDIECRRLLSEFTRQNNALFSFMSDNRYAVLVGDGMKKDFPALHSIGEKYRKFFLDAKNLRKQVLQQGLYRYYSQIYGELESSLSAFNRKKMLPIYAGCAQEQVDFRKSMMEVLKSILKNTSDISPIFPQDLISGFNGESYTTPPFK